MAVISFLPNFENSARELEAVTKPTLHWVIPHLRKLRKLSSDVVAEELHFSPTTNCESKKGILKAS